MSSLRLSTLNDAIEPAQQCIKPPIAKKISKSTVTVDDIPTPEIEISPSLSTTADHQSKEQEIVSVNLGDCLACSGCVTSAETVLISQQTHHQLLQVLQEGQKRVVVTLSPQSITAIALKYRVGIKAASQFVKKCLKRMGVEFVTNTALSQDISLFETAREFVERFQQKSNLPLLTSTCPGWICYAEKTQHNLLHLISTVKSAQQISGTLMKYFYSEYILGCKPNQIFHTSVMSCYDRKLEASRSDFEDEVFGIREVDCVITTSELLSLIGDYYEEEQNELDEEDEWIHKGSGAGGYLEFTLRYAAKHLFDIGIPLDLKHHLLTINTKNTDLIEYTLKDINDNILLRFASVYGFRNIQNAVRKLKSNQAPYDFVEIMACPGACLNGGGQPKLSEHISSDDMSNVMGKKEIATKILSSMKSIYAEFPHSDPLVKEQVRRAYKEWFGGEGSPLLHTKYNKVEFEDKRSFQVQW